MLAEILAPSMQHGGHAQASIQSLGVSSKGLECVPHGLEQKLINHLRVKLHPAIEFMGQRKHQMMIGDRQNVLLLSLAPAPGGVRLALRAMPVPAAMIQGKLTVAVITLITDATQYRRMAVQQMLAHLEAMPIQLMAAEILSSRLVR